MPMLPAAPLVALLLVGATAEATPLSKCLNVVRVEVHVGQPAAAQVVCLSPGWATPFLVDAALLPGAEGLKVEGEGEAPQVLGGTQGFMISLPENFPTGGRYQLTLRFAQPGMPSAVKLQLVVHPDGATHQVQVYRHVRPAEDLVRENKETHAAVEQCTEKQRHLEARLNVGTGLSGLLAGEEPPPLDNVLATDIFKTVSRGKRNALLVGDMRTYRVGDAQAYAVRLENPGLRDWRVAGARLRDAEGKEVPVLPVVQRAPLEPGAKGWLVVELAPRGAPAPGPLNLTLWDEEGKRAVTLGDLPLP